MMDHYNNIKKAVLSHLSINYEANYVDMIFYTNKYILSSFVLKISKIYIFYSLLSQMSSAYFSSQYAP